MVHSKERVNSPASLRWIRLHSANVARGLPSHLDREFPYDYFAAPFGSSEARAAHHGCAQFNLRRPKRLAFDNLATTE